MSMLKKLGLGAVLAATAMSAAAPADAQYYRGYRHGGGGGDVAAGAVLGGILGLGVGAAIASSNNRHYDRGYGYDRGYYYDQPRVVYRERYYTPPARVIIRERYYGNDGYNGYNGYNGYDRGYSDRYQGRGYYGY